MTVATTAFAPLAAVGPMDTAGTAETARVRIAIVSPDILAQIRQVFARKNLAVEFVRLPYVEVVVGPGDGPVAGPSPEDTAAPLPRRLCAEYRLSAVAVDGPAPTVPPPSAPVVPLHGPSATAVAEQPVGAVPALSRRQHEVMALVSRGARNAEIAARLHVSEKTVKNHINRIFRTLGAGSRVEAVLIWQRGRRDDTARYGAGLPSPAPVRPAPAALAPVPAAPAGPVAAYRRHRPRPATAGTA
ncbi:helix-turn-helix transcriptional regulator [Actinacidiphila alni]